MKIQNVQRVRRMRVLVLEAGRFVSIRIIKRMDGLYGSRSGSEATRSDAQDRGDLAADEAG